MRHIEPPVSAHDPKREGAAGLSDKTLAALAAVADAVERLRYGAVLLTIHDGRVVQLDVTERQRFG